VGCSGLEVSRTDGLGLARVSSHCSVQPRWF
jgi:hypothetical protein